MRARVFVTDISTCAKIVKIKACGAEPIVVGAVYAEVQERGDANVDKSAALSVHSYDAPATVAGAGIRRLETSLKRRKCANSGRSGQRTCPLLTGRVVGAAQPGAADALLNWRTRGD